MNITLTFDINSATETRSALEILTAADQAIQAARQHFSVNVQVVVHGAGEFFAELLQCRNPELHVQRIIRCKPCACLPSPSPTERICFQFV